MKKLYSFYLKNSQRDVFQQLALIVFLSLFAFPLYPFRVANILLILFSVLTLISLFKKPLPIGKLVLKNLVFVLPFVPYMIEFIFSGFASVPRFEFEKKLFFFTAFFFIPVFMKITCFQYYKWALLIFSFTVLFLCIYALSILFTKAIPFQYETYENGSYLLRHNFEQLTGIHSTYYAAFALFSSFILFTQKTLQKSTLKIVLKTASVILLLSALYLAVRIAFITVVVFTIFYIFTQKTTVKRKFLWGIVFFVFITGISFLVPSIYSRFNEFISFEKENINHYNTISQRHVIMQCSWDIFTEHFFTGTGIGNYQQKLNTCYSNKSWDEGAALNFNSHNQYLTMGINYGIWGLLVFLVCLFLISKNLIKTPEGISFILLIILFFLTESLLERSMGVYFFGLTSTMLYNISLIKPDFTEKI